MSLSLVLGVYLSGLALRYGGCDAVQLSFYLVKVWYLVAGSLSYASVNVVSESATTISLSYTVSVGRFGICIRRPNPQSRCSDPPSFLSQFRCGLAISAPQLFSKLSPLLSTNMCTLLRRCQSRCSPISGLLFALSSVGLSLVSLWQGL